jgi:transglutaminase-like putative cysteine protease
MNRNQRLLARFAAVILSTLLIGLAASAAEHFPNETWMGIYIGKLKVGYARLYSEKADFEGKPGYRMESTSVMAVAMLGSAVEQNLNTVTYLNTNYEPVHEVFKMSSGGVSTTVTARFTPTEIIADMDSGGKKTSKKIPIPPGSKLVGEDSTLLSGSAKLKVGDKMSYKSFDPLMLALDDVQIEVVRAEDLALEDGKHHCLVIKSTTPLGNATSWQDDDDNLLKVEMDMGFVMVRESKAAAQSMSSGEYAPPADLAVVTSAQTKTKIADPRNVKYLKVRLGGFTDKSLVLSDSRQKAKYTGGENPSAEYRITARDFDASKSATLPIKDPAMAEYLSEAAYIEPDDLKIKAAAVHIVGGEKNAFKAASLIRDWVSENMQTNADIGVIRSSTEILNARTGVCRDYAVLYTALARAAGIPTKIVTGMIYWKDGFYYHAWVESFVGEWVPMDATLSGAFVDATHIKLAEGDTTAMFKMVKAVGTLKAEIVEYK